MNREPGSPPAQGMNLQCLRHSQAMSKAGKASAIVNHLFPGGQLNQKLPQANANVDSKMSPTVNKVKSVDVEDATTPKNKVGNIGVLPGKETNDALMKYVSDTVKVENKASKPLELQKREEVSSDGDEDMAKISDDQEYAPKSPFMERIKAIKETRASKERIIQRLIQGNSEKHIQPPKQVVAQREALQTRKAITAIADNIGNGSMLVERHEKDHTIITASTADIMFGELKNREEEYWPLTTKHDKDLGDDQPQTQTELLVRLIAKEMAAAIMQEANAAREQKQQQHKVIPTSDECQNTGSNDVGMGRKAIACSSRPDQSCHGVGSPDRLRDTLRQEVSVVSSATENTNIMSELGTWSTCERDTDASPIDIWNPDFWGAAAEPSIAGQPVSTAQTIASSDQKHQQSEIELALMMEPDGSAPISSSDADSPESSTSSMHEFVKKFNETMTMSFAHFSETRADIDADDDLSDITGLTGAFDDHDNRFELVDKANSSSRLSTSLRSGSRPSARVLGGSFGNSGASSKNNKKRQIASRSVSFAQVQVRQYERIMTDNPACSTGPSIGIGWRYVAEDDIELDDFEFKRRHRSHKLQSQLMLSRPKREKLIRDLGYTEREIAATVRDLNKVRNNRRQTTNNLGAQKLEESIESAQRQFKKMLFLQSKDRICF